MSPVTNIRNDGPILLGQPHCGTQIPQDILARLNARGQTLVDTDWHVDRLYEGLIKDLSVVRANFHRYVIDPNRSPDNTSLYADNNTTSLVPITDFDGSPIWSEPPDAKEIEDRKEKFHCAYHASLAAEIERIKSLHGFVILFDCHSIRSHIPFLFDGVLPDLNIGTNNGASCAPLLEQTIAENCAREKQFSSVVNGRFKGGWTTRHYGQPNDNVHAIQLELAQHLYLEAEHAPFTYDAEKASRLRPLLKRMLTSLASTARAMTTQENS